MYTFERLTPGSIGDFTAFVLPDFQRHLDRFTPADFAMGARCSGRPVALALACPMAEAGEADVLSLVVAPEHQGKGLATTLLRELEALMRACGIQQVRTFTVGHSAAVEALLVRAQWDVPVLCMRHIHSSPAAVASAPWMRPRALGRGFEVFPWHEEAIDELARQVPGERWYPPDLDPAILEPDWDRETSVGLRYHGEIVGWVINHRVAPDTLVFTCSFVRPDLQRLGRVFQLYQVSVGKMAAAGIPHAVWHVPMHHAGMANFARRWMLPYAHSAMDVFRITKRLAAPEH